MSGSRSSSSGRSSSGISGREKSKRKRKPAGRRSLLDGRLSTRGQFLIRFVVFFLIGFGLWLLTAPAVNAVLTMVSEQIVFLFDGYDLTQSLVVEENGISIYYAPSPDNKPHRINYRKISFNSVFLLALIMAVPNVDPRLRAKILIIGFLLLFPVQILRIVLIVFNHYGQHMRMDGVNLYSDIPRKVIYYSDRIITRLDGQIIPVAIWAGLFFYYRWYPEYVRRTSSD